MTKEIKKAFALAQLRPYFRHPEQFGFANGVCQYITLEGKQCVLGKNLINPDIPSYISGVDYIKDNGQNVLKPTSRGILTPTEWGYMQAIHDTGAKSQDDPELEKWKDELKVSIERLGLFTYEELMA